MKTVFVDSNVFLQFFTQDDHSRNDLASSLFQKAAKGKIQLVTGPPVLFDLAWRLKTQYKQERQRVVEVLSIIVSCGGLLVTDKAVVQDALSLANRCGMDFADAYIAVMAKSVEADEIATFDQKHFKRQDIPLHAF